MSAPEKKQPLALVIAADHGGVHLKAALLAQLSAAGYPVEDIGTNAEASVDYPDYAHKVADGIASGKWDRGILVCGTGVGMSIAANRHAHVRAVVCSDTFSAKFSRSHNNSNVLCLGERVVGPGLAWELVETWLATPASQDARHTRRVEKIEP